MYTATEIALLRYLDPDAVIPGINTQTGKATPLNVTTSVMTTSASAVSRVITLNAIER
jgi:hypothetical protein